MRNEKLIYKLKKDRSLTSAEWERLFSTWDGGDLELACTLARETAVSRFGKNIYFRGIVEFTNYCKNDCYYCGIRRSNGNAERYRLSGGEILECCDEGYTAGFRTFVLQGGEDPYCTDERLCPLIREIKRRHPDCAVSLSLGERSRESYRRLFEAGADRYLLRHETADGEHYRKLHPEYQSFSNRMRCLRDLKETGYQTGCGMMVGTPWQTPECLARDMVFMEKFKPEMIGIGPFIPHKDTPFKGEHGGSVDLTLLCLAACRLMLPRVLLPSTTALGTADSDGRKRGVLAGCNVVMPNLSPLSVRKKYMLYDNKSGTDLSAEQGIRILRRQMEEIGWSVVVGRGDYTDENRKERHD